ncbi:MAG TPA: alanine racemase [Pirellulales bacterium]|nr:alanine racemase [Pirellulales bacterium]
MRRSLTAHWPKHAIAYSFKTNYQVAKSKILQGLGAWAEVVSGREYRMARRLGYAGENIVFNGPWKTDAQLRAALRDGALVNVNDGEELARVASIAARASCPCPIGIRVSSAIDGLPPSRFGFSIDRGEAEQAIAIIHESRNLRLAGLHMHLSGEIDDPDWYREGLRRLAGLLRQSVPGYRTSLRYIDVGGGFPAHMSRPAGRADWSPRPIDEYIKAIAGVLKESFPSGKKPTLILEPGRYLANDGIVFISRVANVRTCAGTQTITSNGSTTMVPVMRDRPAIVRALTPELLPRTAGPRPSVIHGSSCREDDVLFEGEFPRVEVGDFLAHYSAGAYNSSLSPAFIFAPPPLRFLEHDRS